MRNQPYYQQAPNLPLLWRGIAAASLLWLVAICSLEVNANKTSDIEHHGVVASVDVPLHANSEHSLSLKRFFSRHKNQSTSVDLPEPCWILLGGDHWVNQSLLVTAPQNFPALSPLIYPRSWHSPNTPRAPPLV